MRVRLVIEKKKGVFDPEAKVIETSLLNLGHPIENAGLKKVIEFTLGDMDEETAKEKVAMMCTQILVNPVLEQYHFELIK